MASATACPFCGDEAGSFDGEPCVHLIADFGDGSDGDRGIMCGALSRSGNAALDCLEPLEGAMKAFGAIAGPGPGEEMSEEEKTALAQALYGSASVPSWWDALLEDLTLGAISDYTVGVIWRQSVPWSKALVEERVPIGTMAATLVSFVWAQDPLAGAEEIKKAIEVVRGEIEVATKRLVARGWVSWT